jgi:hypothetical protein
MRKINSNPEEVGQNGLNKVTGYAADLNFLDESPP